MKTTIKLSESEIKHAIREWFMKNRKEEWTNLARLESVFISWEDGAFDIHNREYVSRTATEVFPLI